MNLLVLADDDEVRHDLTAQPADLGDLADIMILEAARQTHVAASSPPIASAGGQIRRQLKNFTSCAPRAGKDGKLWH